MTITSPRLDQDPDDAHWMIVESGTDSPADHSPVDTRIASVGGGHTT